jgi:hypothetical protein
VILNRFKLWLGDAKINFPSSNQNAYQQSLCSILTSYQVQECIYYNTERKAKTYLSLLDSSSAFDTVWHDGLFVKLYRLGVKGKLWRLLFDAYQGLISAVVLNGFVSNKIHINQSVRQGSVLGPWLYMVYVHDLALSLQTSPHGCNIGQVPCGGILQADDIVITALTPKALQELLNSCESYSRKWRYMYNPVKSKVMVFNEYPAMKRRLQLSRKFMLYGKEIDEVSEGVHVGIILNAYQNNTQRINNSVLKLRGALLSIVGSGVRQTGLSCLTATKLYKTIVLPRGLYGAELWSKQTKENILKVERAHHFCLKVIQTLPKRTKTVVVEKMVNMYCIETHVELKKLIFLGRLCRLNHDILAKRVFLERLYQVMYSHKQYNTGFLPDVTRILEKYSLIDHIREFVNTQRFPSKVQWENIIHSAIKCFEEGTLRLSLEDPKLKRFAQVYGTSLKVHPMWLMEHNTKGYRSHFRDFIKLNGVVCDNGMDRECIYCSKIYNNQLDHYFNYCNKYQDSREYFWFLILNTCNINLGAFLHNLPESDLTCAILGQRPQFILNDVEYTHFLTICAKIWHVLARERELCYY